MDLRFLGKVLQGALIGLGAVLPGILRRGIERGVRRLPAHYGTAGGSSA